MHVSRCPLNVPLSFSVLLMLFTLQHTTLAALSSSNYQNDLVVPQLQPMLLEVVVQPVLFRAVCRLCLTSRNQLAETMVIPTIAVALIIVTIPHRKLMANHTLLKVKPLINSLRYQCITVARLQLEDMEASDHSNHNNLTSVALNPMPAHLLNRCKAWFLASH
jgi:hypothetical protein